MSSFVEVVISQNELKLLGGVEKLITSRQLVYHHSDKFGFRRSSFGFENRHVMKICPAGSLPKFMVILMTKSKNKLLESCSKCINLLVCRTNIISIYLILKHV